MSISIKESSFNDKYEEYFKDLLENVTSNSERIKVLNYIIEQLQLFDAAEIERSRSLQELLLTIKNCAVCSAEKIASEPIAQTTEVNPEKDLIVKKYEDSILYSRSYEELFQIYESIKKIIDYRIIISKVILRLKKRRNMVYNESKDPSLSHDMLELYDEEITILDYKIYFFECCINEEFGVPDQELSNPSTAKNRLVLFLKPDGSPYLQDDISDKNEFYGSIINALNDIINGNLRHCQRIYWCDKLFRIREGKIRMLLRMEANYTYVILGAFIKNDDQNLEYDSLYERRNNEYSQSRKIFLASLTNDFLDKNQSLLSETFDNLKTKMRGNR